MAKIVKAKKKVYKQKVIAGKYGLVFTSEVTPHLRKVIEEGERDRLSGNVTRCTKEELMQLMRSLHA